MINKAEEFVFHICRETFLSLWSYANPLGKNGKELCDILIVCDPDIVIFSVKEIEFKECIFRSNPASDSGPKWPLIPAESGHRFRSNPATFRPGPESGKSEAALDNLTVFGHHGSSNEERRPRCRERGYPCARSKKC
jgi:hypothetical protein